VNTQPDQPAGEAGATPPARPDRRRAVLRLVVPALLLLGASWVLRGRWEQVRPLLGRLDALTLSASAAAVFAQMFVMFLSWRAILIDLGFPLPLVAGMRVLFVGQLGKYLPGSVWQVVAQMELARGYKVPQRASGAAVAILSLLTIGCGLVLGVMTVPLLDHAALRHYWWLAAVLPAVLVLAMPPVLNRLLGRALALARRQPMRTPLSAGGVLQASGWALAGWLLAGVHIWVLALRLGVGGGALGLARDIGAFALAWCVGFLLVVAPAGAGVRDPALVLLLGTSMPQAQAIVIAAVSRLLFLLGDLGWAGLALLAERRRQSALAAAANAGGGAQR
jgi:hypothetical protein